MNHPAPDWSPHDMDVDDDQIAAFDRMRATCPVAYSDELGFSIFRHADVVRILEDHHTFSNRVSSHLSVPNGMDPPEHTPFRTLIEPYFAPARVEEYVPTFRAIASDLLQGLTGQVDAMDALGHPFAARVQCAFMGWPSALHEPLRDWAAASQQATRQQDRAALNQLADVFDGIIREQLFPRRNAAGDAPDDTTTQLLHERVNGRALTDDELVSIIRNWTAGELGTIATSIGILVHEFATQPELFVAVRSGEHDRVRVIDELLRLDGPLVANRRVATTDVDVGGRAIAAGERITLLWPSANRDETVFGDGVFDPIGNAADNLLYGAGIHVCPGAPLARRELDIFVEALGDAVAHLQPAGQSVRARYPAGGYVTVPVTITAV